jgi:hypothetical protein
MGLVAVWREGLLAQAVLNGKTKGYKNHPQLDRFKKHPEPLQAIASYLHEVQKEAKTRGYNFDASKIHAFKKSKQIQTSIGQLQFERQHLLQKLEQRSIDDHDRFVTLKGISPHPLFQIIPGGIEAWEKTA